MLAPAQFVFTPCSQLGVKVVILPELKEKHPEACDARCSCETLGWVMGTGEEEQEGSDGVVTFQELLRLCFLTQTVTINQGQLIICLYTPCGWIGHEHF